MTVNPDSLQCWIVTEGMAGTENQCLGVADALGVQPVIHRISLRQPWKSLSPYLGFERDWTFVPGFKGPWPDLLLASGRKSIAASRYIRRQSRGHTFTVQIQDPRVSPANFDLVAVPAHDPARGMNVIVTNGAPNRIRTETLARAKNDFADIFALMPSPRIAVLIGGNSRAHRMTAEDMKHFGEQLRAIGGSLMITASRRTTPAERDAFLAGLGDRQYWFWDGKGANPYQGLLAWADHILVTADSVSMVCDAATTGKPVYMVNLKGGSARFDRFYDNLAKIGAIRLFDGKIESWSYAPLRDSEMIADEIRRRMQLC